MPVKQTGMQILKLSALAAVLLILSGCGEANGGAQGGGNEYGGGGRVHVGVPF